jgi:signal transduction histidine kinase/CheY-like chemotaxis protein
MNFARIKTNLLGSVFLNITDPIKRARIFILFYMLLVSVVFCVGLFFVYLTIGPPIQLVRIIIILILFSYGLRELCARQNYKPAAHIVLLVLALLIWTNSFLIINGITIITIQYILLAITCGFYLHNGRWGFFYSCLAILPIVILFFLDGVTKTNVYITYSQAIDPVYIAVLMINFFQLIFINYHFLRSLQSAISQLEKAKGDEAELNKQLKKAIDIAHNSSMEKTDFLSTMSHELRTPLNSVIGMSHLLMADNPRTDQAENLKVLHFSAESLLALINDILDFNKLEYGKIDMEKTGFYPAELIARIHEGLKNQSDEKGINFILNLDDRLKDLVVIGDPTRLLQILFNLVGNAIKFTPRGEVELSMHLFSEDDENVSIAFAVRDTGIGISSEKREVIFEPFAQASDNITRRFGGSGLGLAITKQLLDLHGSQIDLRSEENAGTTFKFTISYKKASTSDIPSNGLFSAFSESLENISSLSILVAEDNAMNILLMKKLFSSWNIKADFAENGQVALEMAEIKFYDVILMDIHMPVMDGYEASKRILRFYEGKNKPALIALTASVANDVIQKIDNAGIDDYISKPFNPNELKDKLAALSRLKTSQLV